MDDQTKYKFLLSETNKILLKQKDYLWKSGEDFNIFSITKIERYENNTHSALISELLNPKGSHHQGNLFLKEFLEIVGPKCHLNESQTKINSFLDKNVSVRTEAHIGKKDILKGTGGRIDILISSNTCCYIVENKIDAVDQERQLERYANYKQLEKHILYLTLDGKDAPSTSSGDLLKGIEFHPISYKEEIIKWLERCVDICENQYVKLGIKQYLNLVKKITHQLKKEYMEELNKMITDNLIESEAIAIGFESAKIQLKKSFRYEVKELLVHKLPNLSISIQDKITDKESSISILIPDTNTKKLSFGIAPFEGGNRMFIGIFNASANEDTALILNPKYKSDIDATLHYPIYKYLMTSDNNYLRMDNIETLSKFKNSDYRNALINKVVEQIVQFVKTHYEEANFINIT